MRKSGSDMEVNSRTGYVIGRASRDLAALLRRDLRRLKIFRIPQVHRRIRLERALEVELRPGQILGP